jgi:hypothetical protein
MINPETGFNPESSETALNFSNYEGKLVEIPEGETKMQPAMRIAKLLRAIEGQES